MRPALLALWILTACGQGGVASPDAAPVPADANPDGAVDAAVDAGGCVPAPVAGLGAGASEILPVGDQGSTLGIFDPAFVYPAGAPGGAMAYSSVADQHSIRTRIALSNDRGATWIKVADVNAPVAATLSSSSPSECPGGACTGFLIDEVSTLILDPADPDPARRWKVMTHRYLAEADNRLHYALGTITLYTAAAPEGPWSPPRPLIGWPSSSPHSQAGVGTDLATIPALADCVALTEPSALVRGATIDLALGCVSLVAGAPALRVVLMRSDDHAATFRFVATLLSPADAACVGGAGRTRYNAAQLFTVGPTTYLTASIGGDDGAYAGCDVFTVAEPVAGTLVRGPGGGPAPVRRFAAAGRFSGACAAAEGLAGGHVMSVLYPEQPPRIFRILRADLPAP